MISLYKRTCKEIDMDLANRLVQLRKRKKITQEELARRSGVALASLRRFERTGEVSLKSFTKLAIALEVDRELDELFLMD
ncbi:MAG: helix-turn-helix transcriptional regulator [Lachnospiraceae bacterium]|nr:helix-turn-helix transcriptional regulator [Lachnospiraceae bacterium]